MILTVRFQHIWRKNLSSVAGALKHNSRRRNAWCMTDSILSRKSFQNCLGSDTKGFKWFREYIMIWMYSFFIISRLMLELNFKSFSSKWLNRISRFSNCTLTKTVPTLSWEYQGWCIVMKNFASIKYSSIYFAILPIPY